MNHGRPIQPRLFQELASAAEESSRNERAAIQYLTGWAADNDHHFYGRHQTDNLGTDRIPNSGWAGKWDPSEGWEEIAFSTNRVTEILRSQGVDPLAVRAAWVQERLVKVSPDVKHPGERRVRVAGTPTWYIVFARDVIDTTW